MNKKLENTLIEKYPSLFAKREDMVWPHLEVSDGWFDIVDELFDGLTAISKTIYLIQVKQKFATLRVYLGGVNESTKDDVGHLLAVAESKSLEFCKICGRGQSPDDSNWFAGHKDPCMKRLKEIWGKDEDTRILAKELFYANEQQ